MNPRIRRGLAWLAVMTFVLLAVGVLALFTWAFWPEVSIIIILVLLGWSVVKLFVWGCDVLAEKR